MKTLFKQKLPTLTLTLLFAVWMSVTAFAADMAGSLDTVDSTHISGWAWIVGSFDETVDVELHIYKDGSKDPQKVVTVAAGQYRSDVSKTIGDGYHSFTCPIDWSELGGSSYKINAYAISGDTRLLLPETLEYKVSDSATVKETTSETEQAKETTANTAGPGEKDTAAKADVPKEEPAVAASSKGRSLGTFTTTGYCNCNKCSGNHNLTYSGTVPKAKHTISADLNVFPLGTKLQIGDIIYTVEDMGSGVNGKKLDIFYSSHEAALAHGMKKQEVFAVD